MIDLSTKFACLLTDISPKLNTKFYYYLTFKKPLNLKNPRTLDEKIQWLKFNTYYKNPLVTQCADKYKVRDYVSECGCADILNELYYVYDDPEQINWAKLPDKFVLKWNFGCGQNFICSDKSMYNEHAVKQMLKDWKKERNTFYKFRAEMQYKNIVPKLLCERLIETEGGTLPKDYKLYCFNGRPDCALVCTNREVGHPDFYFFDRQWNLKRYNKTGLSAPENFSLPKPLNFEKLFNYAAILSKPFPFVRADFYLEHGRVIFGELTFTPAGGLDSNRLPSTQYMFGDMVKLPQQL